MCSYHTVPINTVLKDDEFQIHIEDIEYKMC